MPTIKERDLTPGLNTPEQQPEEQHEEKPRLDVSYYPRRFGGGQYFHKVGNQVNKNRRHLVEANSSNAPTSTWVKVWSDETVPTLSTDYGFQEDPIVSASGSQTDIDWPTATTASKRVNRMGPIWRLHGTGIRNNAQNDGGAQPPIVVTQHNKQQQSLRGPELGITKELPRGQRESHWQCPPPPRGGKQWTQACLPQQHRAIYQEHVLPIDRTYSLISNFGTWGTILLSITIILGFLGIVLWLWFIWQYARNSTRNCHHSRHAREKVKQLLLPYWGRGFGRGRHRKSIIEGWLSSKQTQKGEDTWLEKGIEAPLKTEYPHLNSAMSEIHSENYEGNCGGSAGRLLFGGLVGSLREKLAISSNSFGGGSLRETSLDRGGNYQDSRFALKHKLLAGTCTGGSFKSNAGKLVGLSDSVRSASGTDFMSVEKNDMPLSFRRDAVLCQAMRGEHNRRTRDFGKV